MINRFKTEEHAKKAFRIRTGEKYPSEKVNNKAVDIYDLNKLKGYKLSRPFFLGSEIEYKNL